MPRKTATAEVLPDTSQADEQKLAPVNPRFAKRIERELSPAEKEAKAKHQPAGVYRVIHGRVAMPRPADQVKPGEPVQEYAIPGDEIHLSAAEATFMVHADIVEPLDTKPSRVNAVWKPPTNKINPLRDAKDPAGTPQVPGGVTY